MPELHLDPGRVSRLPSDDARLVQRTVPLGPVDPWSLLDAPQVSGEHLAAWHDPEEDRSFLALGRARVVRVHGESRFADADRALSEMAASRRGVAAELPFALAGFAFSPDERRTGPWADWGDGALWVPELLVHRQAGEHVAVLTASAPDAEARLGALRQRLDELLERAHDGAVPSPGRGVPEPRATEQRESWRRNVNQARAEMADGKLHKVVLARSEALHSPSGSFDAVATARALREGQEHCVSWMVRRHGGQAFVGATPEELVRLHGSHLRTVALAGTRSRGATPEEDEALGQELFASEKDRREQDLVVGAIAEALAPFTTGLDIPAVPEQALFRYVRHLRSTIRAEVRPQVSLLQLVESLHPTPAVGGLPRELALSTLTRLEAMDRGWYAGPLGWLSADGDGVFVVALRSALMRAGLAVAYAGCGLLAQSDADAEWDETGHKLRAVRQALRPGSMEIC